MFRERVLDAEVVDEKVGDVRPEVHGVGGRLQLLGPRVDPELHPVVGRQLLVLEVAYDEARQVRHHLDRGVEVHCREPWFWLVRNLVLEQDP